MKNATQISSVLDAALAGLMPMDQQIEEKRKRYEAFAKSLSAKDRTALSVATQFFAFANDVNQLIARSRKADGIESARLCAKMLEYASVAFAKLKCFAAVEGCRDLAETAAALDRLIDSAERFGWSIAPAWWRKVPQKNTAYFINRLKVNAEERNASLRETPRA